MKKRMKRYLSVFLVIAMLASFAGFLPGGVSKTSVFAADGSAVKIDTSLLKAGQVISVQTSEDVTLLKWYVDGKFVSQGTYTPSGADCEKWIKVEAYSGNTLLSSDSAYFSKLPVIYINTDDGQPVTSKETYKSGTMQVQNNGVTKYTEYNDTVEIKGRGNSTWGWPKKPYKIKLGTKTNMFGMGKNKHWVLLANYLDESLVRNTTAFGISKELGLTTMDTVWVDVVINGAYAGNYQFCEHIRVGNDRIDVFDWESYAEDVAGAVYKANKSTLSKNDKSALEDLLKENMAWITTGKFIYKSTEYTVSDYCTPDNDISGGYLFEMSNEFDELSKFSTDGGLLVMLNTPEYLYTNPEMMAYVQSYWQNLENAYKSEDGYVDIGGNAYHYTELVDIDSAVSYWLTMEIMGNNDAVWKSRYAYLDKGGLMTYGPVWDFDWGCASSVVSTEPTGWRISLSDSGANFYKEYLDDPLFITRAVEKYNEIHDYLISLTTDGGILDQWHDYLKESALKDAALWQRKETWPLKYRGFEKDYKIFSEYLAKRIDWLDKQFASEETLLKSVYTDCSASPYVKSDDKLELSVISKSNNSFSPTAGFNLNINVNDNAVSKINVYVNGIYAATVPVSDNKATASIDGAALFGGKCRRNTVSLIAKDISENTVCRNFIIVGTCDYSVSSSSATCTKSGETLFKCETCGHEITETFAPALGHTDTNSDGVCEICGEKIKLSFLDSLRAFFQRIIAWLRSLFQ